MAGWNLKMGELKKNELKIGEYWSLFNFVFSDSSKNRNTYKFGFLKSILDNLINSKPNMNGYFITYNELFDKFTINYWNLIVKYNLKQMRKDSKSEYSRLESIFKNAVNEMPILSNLEFDSIAKGTKNKIISRVNKECKKYVVGALYEDLDGCVYSFNLKGDGILISTKAYNFMLKYKMELEKLNYYAWAKFLEKINDDQILLRVIDKLELSTPRRNDLSLYRNILFEEFEQDTCFYCGKKLHSKIHVDHFIPWSFVKENKIWNFVLSHM